jgi:putative oxidoreductase
MINLIRNYWKQLPDFSLSHILLRIPLAVVFIQQGFNKLPFDPAVGEGFGLPALVWWVVIYGELAAGVGLLVGAVTTIHLIRDIPFVAELGDLITRMSGITMCCITTGIIWVVTKPESLQQVILYDNFHVFLWAGGLYFALRGNWAVAVNKQLVAKKA